MSNKKISAKSKNSDKVWDENQIKKVKAWLESDEGIKTLKEISANTDSLDEDFSQMVNVSRDQLRQPYTI